MLRTTSDQDGGRIDTVLEPLPQARRRLGRRGWSAGAHTGPAPYDPVKPNNDGTRLDLHAASEADGQEPPDAVRGGCCVRRRGACWLWRPCGRGERGERLAASFPGPRREVGEGSPRVLGRHGVPGLSGGTGHGDVVGGGALLWWRSRVRRRVRRASAKDPQGRAGALRRGTSSPRR
jgi:hypothetical protein